MQFEFDPEALIEEVRKRPGLWDHDTLEYRSKHYKQDAWEEIVRALSGTNENDITKTEMRELEVQLQKKWKSLRDCYIKLLRNPARQRRPYIYTKQLSFIKPVSTRTYKPANKDARTEDEFSSEEEKKPAKKRQRRKMTVKRERKSECTTDDETYLDISGHVSEESDVETGHQTHNNMQSTSGTKPDHFSFANVDIIPNDSDDCDRLFLLSMLPYLKSIPEHNKLNVKMELMQVIQNAKSFNGDQSVL